MKKLVLALTFFVGMRFVVSAQQKLSDTSFIKLVVAQNPQFKIVDLFRRSAEADIMNAKGGFDPKIYGNFDQKQFDGAQYYSQGEYGIKIPTWYGVEFKAAYVNANGSFLNPEEKVPKSGQPVVGVNAPLLQGLFFDERRANVLKSRTFINTNLAERQNALNDFLLDALINYWKWQFSFKQKQITSDALITAQKRLEGVKKMFFLGDRMAMDTLEAFIQVQDRILLFNDASQELNAMQIKINTFIFDTSAQKIKVFVSDFTPNPINDSSNLKMDFDQENFNSNHPTLRQYNLKNEQQNIDLRLKKEKLKPKFNVSYNFLGDGFNFPNLLNDNYKWGFQFSTSTLFRSERAEVQSTQIKLEATKLQRVQKALELENKWRIALSEWRNVQQQLTLNKSITENYKRLFQLETKRFDLGESSFFLINARETKFLEAQIKIAKLQSELQIAQTRIVHAQGVLFERVK